MRTVTSESKDRQGKGVATTAFFVATKPVAALAVSFMNCLVNRAKDHSWKIGGQAMLEKINSDYRICPNEVNKGNSRLDWQQSSSINHRLDNDAMVIITPVAKCKCCKEQGVVE